MDFMFPAILIGIGATLVMDAWALFLKIVWHIPSLNYAMVGRWLAHLVQGRIQHEHIGNSHAVRYESLLGWGAHYVIGIIFALVLLSTSNGSWLEQPRFLPALYVGLMTTIFPYFLLQPCLGMGFAASKLPNPNIARLKTLAAHLAFGVGLFLATFFIKWLLVKV
ncbi:DUF2938 domain-containing protein [Marinomonas agarivorans]|nr:DUF2938 domain-containing protein [Marinomonas agarivorans]